MALKKVHGKLFSLLSDKINLSQTEISQGSTSHNNVRQILKNKQDSDVTFPRLLDGDFLSGSYDRETKIRPLDDIDVLMILDGAGLRLTNGGVVQDVYVKGSGGTTNPLTSYHLDSSGNVSSRKVLDLFVSALKDTFPSTKISKDGQAVNVQFSSYNLGLDIVPCFHIVPHDSQQVDRYYIPTGGKSNLWLATNPKIDAKICDSLHEKYSYNLKPVIKIIKYWNREINGGLLRSYHLEVLAWKVFGNYVGDMSNYASAVKYFFENAKPMLEANCEDPTGIGGRIDAYLSYHARELSILRFEKARRHMKLPLLVYLDHEKNILENWSKAFNDLI